MASYNYPDDGKLHTRYSELIRCTPGQMDRVLAERFGDVEPYHGADMAWGSDRHEMFADEVYRTSLVPECFRDELDLPPLDIMFVEKQMAVELYPGVVIHFTPDSVAVAQGIVIDYKTAVAHEDQPLGPQLDKIRAKYSNSRQLKLYAFLLGLYGHRIRSGLYLMEVWDKDHTKIMAYLQQNQQYKMSDLATIVPWIQERVSLLKAAIELRKSAS